MPKLETIALTIECDEQITRVENGTLKHWQKVDGIKRAALGGIFVLLLAVVMAPFPVIQLGVIPVLLFGFPLVITILYRLFKGGTDLSANICCPACNTTRRMTRTAESWPVQLQCMGCQKHLSISRTDTASYP